MAAYATVSDVQARMTQTMTSDEQALCANLLDDAAVMIDAAAQYASTDAKRVVSCRMVVRAMSNSDGLGVPMGATQGSMAAGGYSQSWTVGSGGSTGELYIGKAERQILKTGNRIGSRSPAEGLVVCRD